MSLRRTFYIIGVLGFVLAACASGGGSAPADPSGLEVAPVVDSLAPDFELENIEGELVSLSDYRGKAVLINFWATWCGPCRIEMPAIQSRFEAHSDEFVVLAVDNNEPQEAVAAFFDELQLTFPGLLDPGGEIQELYRVRGYPSSYFVDQNGVVKVIHIGVMTEGQLDDYLSQVGIDA
ncbi:MAG: hypothetical protein DWQ07_07095 [Chloroflexi bacterium]|nr:MAG: hypothetical protein DWQ07_07095 [Chloroflexota bacterium]MBL1195532.1 hypothetical protein [Chloroflexota bacterium]NOH12814.1 redoxin domain-containing protein [Chloroflexota bacterium]